MLRALIADRMAEQADVRTRVDRVLSQMAEVQRQILALEAIDRIRGPDEMTQEMPEVIDLTGDSD